MAFFFSSLRLRDCLWLSAQVSHLVWSFMARLGQLTHLPVSLAILSKPIPRWDVHFGEIDDDRKDSTAPHITFRLQLGGHR